MFISTHDADRGSGTSFVSAGLLAAALAVNTAGCADLAPANDSCARIPNCLEQEGLPLQQADAGTPPLYVQDPQRWGCLAPGYTPPAVAPATQMMVNHTSIVLDYANLAPLQGLTEKFCNNMDADCIAGPQAVPVPDMAPLITVPIRTGALGYLRQEAPGHVTQDYFLLAPMLKDDATFVGPTNFLFLVSETSIVSFINDTGIDVDRTKGIFSLAIVDCNGDRVEGARITLPERDTKPELQTASGFAINNQIPVPGAATERDGIAGLVNVPLVGSVAVQATLNGQNFGEARIRVLGNRVTSGTIRPLYLTGR